MRISEFLRASFVGALLFTPAMADDIEKVHEEALRVLREKLGQSGSLPAVAPATGSSLQSPALNGDPEVVRMRAEREARIKAEAQERLAERDRLQAQRRQQFEQFVKERERLRQEQRQYDANAARQTGEIKASDYNDVHARALEALHQAQAQTSALNSSPAPIQPAIAHAEPSSPVAVTGGGASSPQNATNDAVTQHALEIVRQKAAGGAASAPTRPSEAEVAPKITAGGPSSNLEGDNSEVHSQALQVLHQMTASGSRSAAPAITSTAAPASAAPSAASPSPGPSPELQQRLKRMQAELEQEQTQRAASSTASPGISKDYVQDLEQRARREFQAGPGASPAPSGTVATRNPSPSSSNLGLDERTREMIRRQNEEVARQMGSTAAAFPVRSTEAKTLSPQDESKARNVLHQAAATAGNNPSQVTQAQPRVSQAATAVAPASPPIASIPSPATDSSNIQYSKELEDRARQILLERSQNQQAATSVPAPEPARNPSPSPTVAPSFQPRPGSLSAAPAPVASPVSSANVEDVHARALETLNQVQSGAAVNPLTRSKQQKLKELTDLYRADKMDPAEYHRKRAQILAEPQ